MLLWPVCSQTFGSNFELASSVAERHEGKYPHQHANGLALGARQSPDMRHAKYLETYLNLAESCSINSLQVSVSIFIPFFVMAYL